jgi:D-alanyl-D-alanine dipeptidase
MQTRGDWGHYKDLQEKHPTWPKSVLRREANKFWHPPDVPKAPPGHCTGGAVDVGLLDAEGNAMDVTSVSREGADAQPTYALYLTPEAKANRSLLITAMSGANFSNCYDEWWHWSYGDCAWAVRLGYPEALYGWVREYPEAVLREIEEMEAERERKAAEERARAEAPVV